MRGAFRPRACTERAWAVKPSAKASVSTAGAAVASAAASHCTRLMRRRKLSAAKPLKNRAVPEVGSTCDGPAR